MSRSRKCLLAGLLALMTVLLLSGCGGGDGIPDALDRTPYCPGCTR
ncbi:hypothetical protein [Ectothiorhodospira lacustris]|nr:hypothetical protein [Ectothiorhodospira lacustris]MCG5501817.1 hypothetical protein [Ectothiorhodospira lacustris]